MTTRTVVLTMGATKQVAVPAGTAISGFRFRLAAPTASGGSQAPAEEITTDTVVRFSGVPVSASPYRASFAVLDAAGAVIPGTEESIDVLVTDAAPGDLTMLTVPTGLGYALE